MQDTTTTEIGISDYSLVYSCLKISVPRDKRYIDSNQLWDQLKHIFSNVSDIERYEVLMHHG